jgi:hypothetical protein
MGLERTVHNELHRVRKASSVSDCALRMTLTPSNDVGLQSRSVDDPVRRPMPQGTRCLETLAHRPADEL